jgi:protein involved in polysaccharide export with SLBB domain
MVMIEMVAALRSTVKKAAVCVAVLAIGLQLGACVTDFGPVMAFSPPVAANGVATRMQSGDQLKIVVYGEDTLSGQYEIGPSGTISMPLIGQVTAAGLTKTDLEGVLTAAYQNGKFLQEPKITVLVVAYRPVYIFGEVQTPGKYAYTTGMDALTVVATSGGFTYRANRNSVLIRHPGETLWREYPLVGSPLPVVPGDLIRVTERYF